MYNNACSNVFVNGQYSSWFNIKRGVRQGDPCSPYFYLIGAEVLSIMLRCNQNIKGIKVNNTEYLLSQFADDTALSLDGSEEGFKATIETLDNFSNISGLIINNEKTQLMWIGSRKNCRIQYLRDRNFTWDPGIITILGIKFSPNLMDMVEINYNGKLTEIEKLLDIWKKRNLTPFGKITIIKSIAFPKILHLILNLPDPSPKFIADLEKIFFKFLWNNKPHKIKSATVKLDYEKGGLKMLDINSTICSLKLSWLRRLKVNNDLRNIVLNFYPDFDKIFSTGGEISNNINFHNQFWNDVAKHYKKLNDKSHPQNINEFFSEFLFYNKNILIDNTPIFIRVWYEANIKRIGDVSNNEKRLMTYQQFIAKFPNIATNFLTFQGIIRAIRHYANNLGIDLDIDSAQYDLPVVWRIILKGNYHIKQILVNVNETHSAMGKWETYFGRLEWGNIFSNTHKISLDPRLKWFQLRVLFRIIPTNRYLHIRKIKDNNHCSFCLIDIETISHLLWSCPHSQTIWKRLEAQLKRGNDQCRNLNLTEKMILFGTIAETQENQILDLIILVGKYYIYTCKFSESLPIYNQFKAYLKFKLNIEKRSKSFQTYEKFSELLQKYDFLFT